MNIKEQESFACYPASSRAISSRLKHGEVDTVGEAEAKCYPLRGRHDDHAGGLSRLSSVCKHQSGIYYCSINMSGTKIETCPMGYHRIENIHNGKVASGTIKAGGQDKKAPGTYIKWNAPGVENIPDDEEEKIKQVSAQFNRFQMMNFNEHMHCLRGTHLKTQGVSTF